MARMPLPSLAWLRPAFGGARAVALVLGAALACLAAPASAQLVEYYHTDLVGNVRVVTDEKKNVIERHDYLPFGEECTTGPCASNPGLGGGQPRKFTGKERDAETGLDYFGARYYAAPVGRFTSVDPVHPWQESLADPQRWNRYAYGLNNPYRYVDPDGRVPRVLQRAAQQVLFARARRHAVRKAWRMEREILVKQGPGAMTMRLTKAEQAELLKTGKVEGWIGHHIKNVADHDLKAAGDPNNIKFVKGIDAHLAEHGGDFTKPTSGARIDRDAILGNLLGLLPGAVLLDLAGLGGEAAHVAGDYVEDKVKEGAVGEHVRRRDETLRNVENQP